MGNLPDQGERTSQNDSGFQSKDRDPVKEWKGREPIFTGPKLGFRTWMDLMTADHDGPSAGHDGKTQFRHFDPDLTDQSVIKVAFVETSGTEDGHARPHEMEFSKTLEALQEDQEELLKFLESGMRPFQEALFPMGAAGFSPKG